jgi:hypothetical protein
MNAVFMINKDRIVLEAVANAYPPAASRIITELFH